VIVVLLKVVVWLLLLGVIDRLIIYLGGYPSLNQKQIDNGKGGWKLVEVPKPENVVELDVDEEFIGVFVGSKPNPNFEGELIHVFETEGGNMRMMYGKTNLDRWMEQVSPGTRVRVKRLDDKKIGQPKPLHVFRVWIWED